MKDKDLNSKDNRSKAFRDVGSSTTKTWELVLYDLPTKMSEIVTEDEEGKVHGSFLFDGKELEWQFLMAALIFKEDLVNIKRLEDLGLTVKECSRYLSSGTESLEATKKALYFGNFDAFSIALIEDKELRNKIILEDEGRPYINRLLKDISSKFKTPEEIDDRISLISKLIEEGRHVEKAKSSEAKDLKAETTPNSIGLLLGKLIIPAQSISKYYDIGILNPNFTEEHLIKCFDMMDKLHKMGSRLTEEDKQNLKKQIAAIYTGITSKTYEAESLDSIEKKMILLKDLVSSREYLPKDIFDEKQTIKKSKTDLPKKEQPQVKTGVSQVSKDGLKKSKTDLPKKEQPQVKTEVNQVPKDELMSIVENGTLLLNEFKKKIKNIVNVEQEQGYWNKIYKIAIDNGYIGYAALIVDNCNLDKEAIDKEFSEKYSNKTVKQLDDTIKLTFDFEIAVKAINELNGIDVNRLTIEKIEESIKICAKYGLDNYEKILNAKKIKLAEDIKTFNLNKKDLNIKDITEGGYSSDFKLTVEDLKAILATNKEVSPADFSKILERIEDINGPKEARNLHLGISEGNTELVGALLQHPKIDVNLPDNNGKTPLHLAIEKGNTKLVETLLKHPKIDVNLPDNNGKTPLHLAIESGNTKMVEALLESPNINVNILDKGGNTVFHLIQDGDNKDQNLIQYGDNKDKMINLLLNKGAAPNLYIKNNKGEVALEGYKFNISGSAKKDIARVAIHNNDEKRYELLKDVDIFPDFSTKTNEIKKIELDAFLSKAGNREALIAFLRDNHENIIRYDIDNKKDGLISILQALSSKPSEQPIEEIKNILLNDADYFLKVTNSLALESDSKSSDLINDLKMIVENKDIPEQFSSPKDGDLLLKTIQDAIKAKNHDLAKSLLDKALLPIEGQKDQFSCDISKLTGGGKYVEDAKFIQKALKEHDINSSYEGDTILHLAIKNGYNEAFNSILANEPEARGLLGVENLDNKTPSVLIEESKKNIFQIPELKESASPVNKDKKGNVKTLEIDIAKLEGYKKIDGELSEKRNEFLSSIKEQNKNKIFFLIGDEGKYTKNNISQILKHTCLNSKNFQKILKLTDKEIEYLKAGKIVEKMDNWIAIHQDNILLDLNNSNYPNDKELGIVVGKIKKHEKSDIIFVKKEELESGLVKKGILKESYIGDVKVKTNIKIQKISTDIVRLKESLSNISTDKSVQDSLDTKNRELILAKNESKTLEDCKESIQNDILEKKKSDLLPIMIEEANIQRIKEISTKRNAGPMRKAPSNEATARENIEHELKEIKNVHSKVVLAKKLYEKGLLSQIERDKATISDLAKQYKNNFNDYYKGVLANKIVTLLKKDFPQSDLFKKYIASVIDKGDPEKIEERLLDLYKNEDNATRKAFSEFAIKELGFEKAKAQGIALETKEVTPKISTAPQIVGTKADQKGVVAPEKPAVAKLGAGGEIDNKHLSSVQASIAAFEKRIAGKEPTTKGLESSLQVIPEDDQEPVKSREEIAAFFLKKAVESGAKNRVSVILNSQKSIIGINEPLIDKETALHIAAEKGDKEMVALLLGNGSDPNMQGKDERTALHIAAEKGDKEMVALLLDKKGADLVDIKDKDGKTALHIAAKNGNVEIVELLLSKGASEEIEDKSGVKPKIGEDLGFIKNPLAESNLTNSDELERYVKSTINAINGKEPLFYISSLAANLNEASLKEIVDALDKDNTGLNKENPLYEKLKDAKPSEDLLKELKKILAGKIEDAKEQQEENNLKSPSTDPRSPITVEEVNTNKEVAGKNNTLPHSTGVNEPNLTEKEGVRSVGEVDDLPHAEAVGRRGTGATDSATRSQNNGVSNGR